MEKDNNELMLDVGQANEIKLALRREGAWTNKEIKEATETKGFLTQVHDVLIGKAVIKKIPSALAIEVWKKQIINLQRNGYALDVLDVPPFPNEEKLALGPALLVDYKTSIEKQCQNLHIKVFVQADYGNWIASEFPHKGDKVRWKWSYGIENGKRFFEPGPYHYSKHRDYTEYVLKLNNRDILSDLEGLALYRENPEILKDHFLRLGSEGLYLFKNEPEYGHIDANNEKIGIPSALGRCLFRH